MASPRLTPREVTLEGSGLAQFGVQVQGLNLGYFTGCEGLSAEYAFEEIIEGGNNAYVYRLPGRIKYPTVKLTRLISDHAVWHRSRARLHLEPSRSSSGEVDRSEFHG
jgi:T4-like virus tail tube protein gp19